MQVCEKSAVRYVSVNFTRFLHEWKIVKNKVYNARKQGWIIGLTVSRCGNSGKPPVKFLEVSNTRKRGGILGLTVSRCRNSGKPLVRESRLNPRVDCFQVWKPSGNHIGVSSKWKLRGNYWCHESRWFPAGFQFFSPIACSILWNLRICILQILLDFLDVRSEWVV